MGKIIELKKISLDEIDSVNYTEHNGHLICRFITYDGYTRDFNIGCAKTKVFNIMGLQRMIKFMASLGQSTEEYLSVYGELYHNPDELSVFSCIRHFELEVHEIQILDKYDIKNGLYDACVYDKASGAKLNIFDMVIDYRGHLRKYLGSACAKELIIFYETFSTEYKTHLGSERTVII